MDPTFLYYELAQALIPQILPAYSLFNFQAIKANMAISTNGLGKANTVSTLLTIKPIKAEKPSKITLEIIYNKIN